MAVMKTKDTNNFIKQRSGGMILKPQTSRVNDTVVQENSNFFFGEF